MTNPIVLWQSERTLSTDDAGVAIINSTSPPKDYFQPGPYNDEDSIVTKENRPASLRPIPPLSYFCIKCLVQFPELIYHYGPPRPYRPPTYPCDPDILRALIPRKQGRFNLSNLDPRLWVILVQIYSDLPHGLQIYCTALSDKYIPLLQHVPATEHFTLLTVLELQGCSHLNDDTIVHLKVLHTLYVLDASRTVLSATGIRRLSGTLRWDEDTLDYPNQRRGPWQLRILSLHNCKRVTNAIYQYLESFILLTAVDLRGTSCTWDREKIPSSFLPAVEKGLYYPARPLEALSLLSNSQGVLPSTNSGVLHIDQLTHTSRKHSQGCADLSDIGFSAVAEDLNTANHSPDLSSFSPERAPSFERPPLCTAGELLQWSMEELESGPTDLHTTRTDVATGSDAQYKAKMFYSQSTVDDGSSMAHQHKHMPQWGQELLMLYREPPPWSRAGLSPFVKAAPRARGLEEPMAVDRTNMRATKGVQEMQDILSERRRSTKEADSSYDGVKASTKHFASRNPFAVPFERPSASTLPHTNVTIAPPKPLRSLKPISTLPIPVPPDLSEPVTANNSRGSMAAPYDPRQNHALGGKRRPVSLPVRELCGQKVASKTERSVERAEPVAAKKRLRPAVSASGNKKQKHDDKSGSRSREFDWSSWGVSR